MGMTAMVTRARSHFISSMAMTNPTRRTTSPMDRTKMERNSCSCCTSFWTLDMLLPTSVRWK